MKLVTVFLFVVYHGLSFAQPPEKYYKSGKHVFNLAGLDSFLMAREKHAQDLGMPNMKAVIEIKDRIYKEDSLIHIFTLKLVNTEFISKIDLLRERFVGKPFPDFKLAGLNGEVSSADFLKQKKPMVINCWFTQCMPCIKEMPDLNKLIEEYKAIHFLAITYNSDQEINDFLKVHDFRFLHIHSARSFLNSLGVSNYPTTFFIDKDGIVQDIIIGATANGFDKAAFATAMGKIEIKN